MHRKKQCQLRVPAQIATKTCQSQNLSKTSKTDRNNRPEIRDGPPFSEVVVNCCSPPCYLRQRKTHQRLAVGEIGWPKPAGSDIRWELQAAQGRSRSEPQDGKDMETENLNLRLRLVGTPYFNTFCQNWNVDTSPTYSHLRLSRSDVSVESQEESHFNKMSISQKILLR